MRAKFQQGQRVPTTLHQQETLGTVLLVACSSIAFSVNGVCQQLPNDIDIDAIDWPVHSPTLDSNLRTVGHHVSRHSPPPYNTTDPDHE